MGMFSVIRSVGGALAGAARSITKTPVLGTVARGLPIVGTALAGYQGIQALQGLVGGGGGGGMPTLPQMGGNLVPFANSNMGNRSIFRNDPNVVEQLKQYAIAKTYLKQYYRAPTGFVVRYDQAGEPYGIPKKVAQMYGMYKPAKKPPISVRDWNCIQGADRVVKKLKDIDKKVKRIANFRAPVRKQEVILLPNGNKISTKKVA